MHRRVFVPFNGINPDAPLPGLLLDLYRQQIDSWPELAAGVAALDHVRIRELHCNGFTVKLQLNPARITSTAAKLDAQSIKSRPCFLCMDHLPQAQKGILYREEFLILCNPFPIFKHHCTVSHIDHTPQAFSGVAGSFLKLVEDLSPHYAVLYNGPGSGASAPDHLHFQILPVHVLPIEEELERDDHRIEAKSGNGTSIIQAQNLGREIIVIQGSNLQHVKNTLLMILGSLKDTMKTPNEPMMNLHGSYIGDTWQVLIFPRRKHRPAIYFKEGPDKMLISPGLIDMGGVVITPVEQDFYRIDAELMTDVYKEISLNPDTVQQAIHAVSL